MSIFSKMFSMFGSHKSTLPPVNGPGAPTTPIDNSVTTPQQPEGMNSGQSVGSENTPFVPTATGPSTTSSEPTMTTTPPAQPTTPPGSEESPPTVPPPTSAV